jgi:hypothetical protein
MHQTLEGHDVESKEGVEQCENYWHYHPLHKERKMPCPSAIHRPPTAESAVQSRVRPFPSDTTSSTTQSLCNVLAELNFQQQLQVQYWLSFSQRSMKRNRHIAIPRLLHRPLQVPFLDVGTLLFGKPSIPIRNDGQCGCYKYNYCKRPCISTVNRST